MDEKDYEDSEEEVAELSDAQEDEPEEKSDDDTSEEELTDTDSDDEKSVKSKAEKKRRDSVDSVASNLSTVSDEQEPHELSKEEVYNLKYGTGLTKEQKTGVTIKKIITGNKRRISEQMTLYIFTELVGIRAKHISNGAMCLVPTKPGDTADKIAIREIMAKKCPLKLHIPCGIGGNIFEEWHANEMTVPQHVLDTYKSA